MLDRYDFEHELATAARGPVFRARDKTTGCVVAIKIVPGGSDSGLSGLDARFSRLSSPDIGAVHETGQDGQLRYVVSDFAPGRDLSTHVHVARLLPLDTVLHVAARVAKALHHAHLRGVVHGDVKPANIVFDAVTASVQLVDFACAEEAQPGTPAYLSPERLCGDNASAASDQFALGITLYQLACGELPFTGRSRPLIAYSVVNVPHTDVRAHAPSLSAALAAILDKALAKRPEQRYRSLQGMARALGRLIRARARTP